MSNIVSGLCYRAKFGCPKRKAVAVAMGDHAHDDGTSIYPSVRRLSAKVEWSERTVQRVLRELEAIGVLVVVEVGGNGPKDTREWSFDMEILSDLADGHLEIVDKGDCESPIEGDSLSPIELLRVSTRPIRVTGSTPKGDSAVTRTLTNHKEPSGARVRASDKSARASAAQAEPASTIQITRAEHPEAFAAWLAWHKRHSISTRSYNMERWGATVEETLMPPADRIDGAQKVAQRMIGESVE